MLEIEDKSISFKNVSKLNFNGKKLSIYKRRKNKIFVDPLHRFDHYEDFIILILPFTDFF